MILIPGHQVCDRCGSNLSFRFRLFHKQGTNMVPILSLHVWNLYLMCMHCKFTPNHHSKPFVLATVLKLCGLTWTMQIYGRLFFFFTLSKAPNLATKILHWSKWIWISVPWKIGTPHVDSTSTCHDLFLSTCKVTYDQTERECHSG